VRALRIAEGAQEPMFLFQSCSPAGGIVAAFEFAEVGISRWQL